MRFPEFKGEWRRLSIEDVAEVIGGGTPDTRKPDFWDGKIQWFTPTEVGKQKYVISSKRTITELGLSSSSAKLLPRGSILLATRATIGPASISMNPNGVTTNQGFQSLVPKDIEDIEFLYYVIERPEIQKEMNRRSSGSTFNEISHSQVSSIRIGWPSKEERQKISTFLAIIDRRIDVQRKTIEDSSVLKKDVETSFFESLSPTDIAKVGDVVDYERPDQYIVKSDRYKNAGIPVLTANKGFILGYTDEMDGIYAKGAAVIFDDFTEASQYVDFPFKVKSSAIKILTPKTNQINSLYIQAYLEYLKLESSEHKRHYLSDIVGYDFLIPSQGDFSSFIGTLATVIQWIEVLKKE